MLTTSLIAYDLVKRYTHRPAEEFYHTAEDRFERNNLAGSTEVSAMQNRLMTELDRWLAEQGDPGIAEDTPEAHRAAKQGNHLYGPTGE